jgi:hypothetical protein
MSQRAVQDHALVAVVNAAVCGGSLGFPHQVGDELARLPASVLGKSLEASGVIVLHHDGNGDRCARGRFNDLDVLE